MNKEPIMEFKNQEELDKSLQEWKQRLFLSDWNIKAYLVHGEELPDCAGDSNVQWVNSCGTIRIRYADELPKDMIEKDPHEKILVHELLHFKMFGYTYKSPTVEEIFYDEKHHQLLEQFAKSLIMAKYGVSYEWFKN